MDGRFLNAFTLLPSQRVICGYQSKPICLRHRIVLKQIGSPFSEGGVIPTPQDIILAAKILSFTTLEDMLTSEVTDTDIQWVKEMIDNPDVMVDQSERIQLAIDEQSHWPIFWDKEGGGGRDQGIPWVLNVVCNLVKNGIPLESAWTMPESQAIWMHASFAILSGADTDIVSEADRKAMEQLKKLEDMAKENPSVKPVHPKAAKATSN